MESNMHDRKSALQRRQFLLTLGTGGAAAAAAVAAAAGKTVPEAAAVVDAAAPSARDAGVSEHMRRYYRSARI
ncbi:hypothetical protein [Aromatoleum buckelii]|uniref:Formate dehydrogenase region TAT target n=1 Tax=Aromatoleum buckelii TaxID=200254 RepID=A0ABX1MZ47_9RHOO|nr:hypothetical protein [Aromatoleum buckelii]MCK0510116.1 hypothetical protein [Aromatoleum buckelii]